MKQRDLVKKLEKAGLNLQDTEETMIFISEG